MLQPNRVLQRLVALALAVVVAVPLSFQTIDRGAYSGVTTRGAVLVTDSAAWQSLWQQTAGIRSPTPAPPAVDFSSSSVVAVYMGEQRTGGYSVEVTGAELVDGTLKAAVRETRPAPGSTVTMALTQPYHLVRIPRVPAGTKLEVRWK